MKIKKPSLFSSFVQNTLRHLEDVEEEFSKRFIVFGYWLSQKRLFLIFHDFSYIYSVLMHPGKPPTPAR